MKILFCVPAYGSDVRVETAMALASGVMHITQTIPNAEVRLFAIDMAEIARVRNLFASMALQDGFDALLMLDSDMSVPPETFTRLLMSPYEVCGVTYPKREIDLERFRQLAAGGADLNACTAGALNFIAAGAFVHKDGRIDVKDSFLEMKELPGGCMMIRTSALKRMWKDIPAIRQTDHIGDIEERMGLKKLIRCFDNIQKGNSKFSEDLSFCRRWTGIGGQIFAIFDVPVAHFGHMRFEGKYSDFLMPRATNVSHR